PDARQAGGARVEARDETVRFGSGPRLPPEIIRRHPFPTAIPGTEAVEARAPDPAGGPGYGVPVARTREGVPCVGSEGRVVGDRVGGVDLRLALFDATGLTGDSCRPLSTAPTRERACDIGSSYSSVDDYEGDAFLRRARIERRLQAGRMAIRGQCHPDVVRVTLRTPRDVRTLVPSPVGRAILAVYDGDFVAGDAIITAHFGDGRTWRERVPLGF
ncbi:MAG TPA: hypothetical protein VGW10_07825, partial [Solirubrobacteraceae bacterium]|nr:hypothetical protein [Solirubrobacteraceae bacterium]